VREIEFCVLFGKKCSGVFYVGIYSIYEKNGLISVDYAVAGDD
jgi:hypothetical protein